MSRGDRRALTWGFGIFQALGDIAPMEWWSRASDYIGDSWW